MNLHEYQAKQVLREYGIATPRGTAIDSASQADGAIAELGGDAWVVKAQIHAGGRGKADGVKLVRSREAFLEAVNALLGKQLVTYQNAPDGQRVSRLLIEETLPIARELYLSLTVDRESERVALVASSEGGMEIEEVAHATPEKILKEFCDPLLGLQDFQCRALAFGLNLEGKQIGEFGKLAKALYRLFMENDLAMVEINPLIVTATGSLVALDCKIGLDDNALYRRKKLAEMNDPTQSDPKEMAAKEFDLNYIALAGNIGCMVNGAGLAMATMDLIKLHGGQPANFLDVGGGATAEVVSQAFKIILSDAKVKAILVNIFGGIMRCDIIAEGIITAVREVGVKVPVIVRLEGTNVELGQKMLAESGVGVISASDLTDAAKRAVAAVQ
ncbi:MAG: succinate--CoA ligase subunit beta [Betaproteobacteria bacterium CG2_30_59_46]|nr:MAG: succinate--CoA ligase subunit beta [Betaproteobacteria bacterium CG2_30_59_46]PIQ14005.1 MAG: ADP-forming succinate--CoA ligase subunit beta [Hydrogenophilales bacterium CG18_big_fil_WC_8_21_14_2_50_58_12]PIX99966.1 MAG: ADP-forming succinate--CoA ligase subunit beta [Hydrogenophilales bacterium CG_4_10_14_3_um_filter_58_23]PJB08309.1 MAG: ADP-forming succinate--CoA ligase subunit beta [Hydrogenophilales bacterium CG_4_9_14_3_um_filter_59_35]